MLTRFNRWLLGIFSDSDVNKLFLALAIAALGLWVFSAELAPILGALLIAYVLDGAVVKIGRRWPEAPHALVVSIVVLCAIVVAIFAMIALPRFLLQLRELGGRIPEPGNTMDIVVDLVNRFVPASLEVNHAEVAAKSAEITGAIAAYIANNIFSYAGDVFSTLVYLILLPLLVFFLLRDKRHLAEYSRQFLPESRIFGELWEMLDEQFGSYIRGKLIEAVIVGSLMWIVMLWFKMDYALALAILVGLSVFVPFVGAIAVTFPVVLFTYLQFGWSAEFAYVVGAYTVIQLFDGQVLVPLLFSEVIRIHPVALFFALLFFGKLWGVWGVFFAIPLASLVKCIITVVSSRRRGSGAVAVA